MACNPRASTARRRFSLIKEVTCGVTPTNPAYVIVPHLRGSGLNAQQNFERSELQKPTRQGGQQIGGTTGANARILTPVINETAFDWLMESAMGAALAVVDLTVSVAYAASGKTATRSSGSFLTDPATTRLAVGDKIALEGTANQKTTLNGNITSSDTSIVLTSAALFPVPAAGSYYLAQIETGSSKEWVKYTGVSSNTLTGVTRGWRGTAAASHNTGSAVVPVRTISALSATVITFISTDILVDETAVSTTIRSNRERAASSTGRTRFSIEDASLDQSLFQTGKGFEVNDAEITIPTSGGLRASFTMVGQSVVVGQESGASYTALNGNTSSAASIVGTLLTENGSAFTGVESLTLRIRNGREAKFAVGSPDADHISEGDFDFELEATAYRDSLARITAYLAGTRKAIIFRAKDQDKGDAYQWTIPRAVYTRAEGGESGNTITDQCTLFAEDDPTLASKLVFEKIWA